MTRKSFAKRRKYLQELRKLALRRESFIQGNVRLISKGENKFRDLNFLSRLYKVPEPRGLEMYLSVSDYLSRRVTKAFNSRTSAAGGARLDDSFYFRKEEGFKIQDYQGRTG